jgi:hypothetical protein
LRGLPNAAVRVVQSAPWYQRVVIRQNSGIAGAFVSLSAAELETGGSAVANIPGEAFQLAIGISSEFVLEPNQHLVAAASLLPTRISVSVSAKIEIPAVIPALRGEPATFRQFVAPPLGRQVPRVVQTGLRPRRVLIESYDATSLFISASAAELSGASAIPGEAFEFSNEGVAFIVPPQQALYAARTPPSSGVISVSVGEVDYTALRGPTGIPGPDSEE